MAVREAPDDLKGVVEGNKRVATQHAAQCLELRRGPMREVRQRTGFDFAVVPVAFAQQDGRW
jgi:hypothetical protein